MREGTSDSRKRIPCALSIAGSDSGGGAGIQADLKAFAACGVHGMTAITAVTAQNTVGVDAVHAVPPEMIIAQVRAVARDIGVDAVKIGMLGKPRRSTPCARALDELAPGTPVVLDPVMVAESGAELLDPAARGALVQRLLPRATVITPNLPEARALLGAAAAERARRRGRSQLRACTPSGPPLWSSPAATASRRPTCSTTATSWSRSRASAIPTAPRTVRAARTSSVLAARLAWGDSPLQAARTAKRLTSEAVRRRPDRRRGGAGPVDVLGVT